jgi:hypothetical protein
MTQEHIFLLQQNPLQTTPTIRPYQADPNITPKLPKIAKYKTPSPIQSMNTDQSPVPLALPPTLHFNQQLLGNPFHPEKKDQPSTSKSGNQTETQINNQNSSYNTSIHNIAPPSASPITSHQPIKPATQYSIN